MVFEAGNEIDLGSIQESFARFFDVKIKNVSSLTNVDNNVYNQKRRLIQNTNVS